MNAPKLLGFPYIPLNSSRNFTMQVASSGCEVYIPVETREEIPEKKKQLREFLDSQVPYEPPVELA